TGSSTRTRRTMSTPSRPTRSRVSTAGAWVGHVLDTPQDAYLPDRGVILLPLSQGPGWALVSSRAYLMNGYGLNATDPARSCGGRRRLATSPLGDPPVAPVRGPIGLPRTGPIGLPRRGTGGLRPAGSGGSLAESTWGASADDHRPCASRGSFSHP